MIALDTSEIALICFGLLAVMFMVGVYGWMRAAAQADEMSWDDERRWLHELKELP